MKVGIWQLLRGLPRVVATEPPDPQQQAFRIRCMERDIGLPAKIVVLSVLAYYLFPFSHWFETVPNAQVMLVEVQEVILEVITRFFILYLVINLAAGIMLLGMDQLPLRFVQLVVFCVALIDGLMLGALTLLTGGFGSLLFWVFLGLIMRNAISVPEAPLQIILNLMMSACYILAGFLARAIDQFIGDTPEGQFDVTGEPFIVRLALLLLMTLCCYGVQVLLDKQRLADEEAREFALRQEQLRVTGRLAAEIAHQLKNPLGIINNAAFNLQRNVKEGKATITQQIRIIREEVERSDRIITDMMGYARLADGKLERLNAINELDVAIDQVFPSGANFEVTVHRDYARFVPPLLMQRNHLLEIFINILQNAREAMNGKGNLWITAHYSEDYSVMVTIQDDGPGVPAELHDKIFEPYFTTREKGSGLGLAIVKHNIEIYGGTVKVTSEPGKGARFILQLPAKSFMKLQK